MNSTVATLTGSQTLSNKKHTKYIFTTNFSIGSIEITEAELETIDGITNGTAGELKLVYDANRMWNCKFRSDGTNCSSLHRFC